MAEAAVSNSARYGFDSHLGHSVRRAAALPAPGLRAVRRVARGVGRAGRRSVPCVPVAEEDDADGPRVRRAAIPDDALLVVRGLASIEPETSIRQAELFRRRFERWGRYGLSAFYARSDDEVLDLGEDRLGAFATLFVYKVADLRQAGFDLVPTYRSPHVTITFYDDVADGVRRLLAVGHQVVVNPGYRREVP